MALPLFYIHDLSLAALSHEDSKHCSRVLRLTSGDKILLTDGKGNVATGTLLKSDPKECTFKIVEQNIAPKKSFSIHLAIAPTKNADRMEWMVEKCVEIGVDEISFVLCKTSERKSINLERIEKVAISAMKQSQHYWLPKLNAIVPFQKFISLSGEGTKFIAFVDESNPNHLKSMARPGDSYTVLVGPEGDFSKEELDTALDNGFQKVSLGPNRLRTETAGLTAVMILNLVNTH